MVFNSAVMVGVSNLSANVWQYVACNPERLSSEQVLDLIFCFPLHQLGRLAFCLWTFFCFPPPPDSYYDYYYSSSSSSDDSSDYDSHSD